MTDKTENQLIAELARDLISQTVPQELPLFRANSEAFFSNPEKLLAGQKGKDEMLGFGVGEAITMLSPVILMVTSEIVKFLIEELGHITSLKNPPAYPKGWDKDKVKVWLPKFDEFEKLREPWLADWNKAYNYRQ